MTYRNIHLDCILLDSESTVHAFCNKNLVQKVWESSEPMTLHGNGGQVTTTHKCKVINLKQEVWFHPEYITNVLSLEIIKNQYRISYDSEKDAAFVVHRPGKINLRFECHKNVLQYLYVGRKQLSLVSTVQENKEGFSTRQIKDAEVDRYLYHKVGCVLQKTSRK